MTVATQRLTVELEERLLGELVAALAADEAFRVVFLVVEDRVRARYRLAAFGAVRAIFVEQEDF